MTTDSNVNSTTPQVPVAVTDPLTGQTLGSVPQQQIVSTPTFSEMLAQEQQAVNGNTGTGFMQQLTSMIDVNIRRLRLDIAHEIKNHVMKGDRESLKDAQERYNQCTVELRKRAGILDGTTTVIPLGSTSTIPLNVTTVPLATSTIISPGTTAIIPLSAPITTFVPQPSTENVFPEGNPLQLLYQSPYGNQPLLYKNQSTLPGLSAGTSSFSNSSSLITPEQLNNPQILVNPLYNQDLNQMQQWNTQQLQMLELQLQQGMSGYNSDQQNSSISF